MKKLKIVSLLTLLLLFGMYFMYVEGSLPVDKSDEGSTIFVINKGEGLNSIIKRLAAEDLIRNKLVFYAIALQKGIEKKVQAGDFKLSKKMTASEVADMLTHGTLDEWVTVVEGLRKEEVAQKLAQTFTFSEISFIEQAKEGQLFPDTYLIPKTASVEAIIQIMESNFKKRWQKRGQSVHMKSDLIAKFLFLLPLLNVKRSLLMTVALLQVSSLNVRKVIGHCKLTQRFNMGWGIKELKKHGGKGS